MDYVRMIRSRRDIDWSYYLAPGDEAYLQTRIAPDYWYPMDAFARLGMGILKEIAGGDMSMVRTWGRASADDMVERLPDLVTKGDPPRTLRYFASLRSNLFDFNALQIVALEERVATVGIAYHMEPLVEEAAAYQTLGFFDRLLELSGASGVDALFDQRSWTGAPRTVAVLTWTPPPD